VPAPAPRAAAGSRWRFPRGLWDAAPPACVLSDSAERRFAVRAVASGVDEETRGRLFTVNGQRVFVRGGNYIASDLMLRQPAPRVWAEVALLAAARLNMLRCWGGAACQVPSCPLTALPLCAKPSLACCPLAALPGRCLVLLRETRPCRGAVRVASPLRRPLGTAGASARRRAVTRAPAGPRVFRGVRRARGARVGRVLDHRRPAPPAVCPRRAAAASLWAERVRSRVVRPLQETATAAGPATLSSQWITGAAPPPLRPQPPLHNLASPCRLAAVVHAPR
jgi:hypothetical protein